MSIFFRKNPNNDYKADGERMFLKNPFTKAVPITLGLIVTAGIYLVAEITDPTTPAINLPVFRDIGHTVDQWYLGMNQSGSPDAMPNTIHMLETYARGYMSMAKDYLLSPKM